MTTDKELDDMLRAMFANLAAAQRPLEPEFAKVLRDNLWDLYETGPISSEHGGGE